MRQTPTLQLEVKDWDEKVYTCVIKKTPSIETFEQMRPLIADNKYVMAGQLWVTADWVEGDQEILEHEDLLLYVAGAAMDNYQSLAADVKKN